MSYIRGLSAIGLTLVLSACGSSGPSTSDAQQALIDQVLQFSKSVSALTGQQSSQSANDVKLKVKDLKCKKEGDDIYTCDVLANVNGEDVTDRDRFTKLGGKWQAQHIQ